MTPPAPDLDRPTLRLREPIDVLCAIPFVLGYHPAECVVAVGVRGTRLHFTLRLDLPPIGATEAEIASVARRVSRAMRAQQTTGAIFVGFGPEGRVNPVLQALQHSCADTRIKVNEALRAHEGRYWSLICTNPECCPPEGTPYDPHTGLVAAEATLAGCTALPDYRTYVAQLEPAPPSTARDEAADSAAGRLIDLLHRAVSEKDAIRQLARAGAKALATAIETTRAGGVLTDDEIAWLSALVLDVGVRDQCWERISGPPSEVYLHRALWLDVLRRCVPDLLAAPACLFAFAAFRGGDTKLAMLAIDRALLVEPRYSLAHLLQQVITRGVSPAAFNGWPRIGPGRDRRSPGRARRGRGGRKRSSSRREESRRR